MRSSIYDSSLSSVSLNRSAPPRNRFDRHLLRETVTTADDRGSMKTNKKTIYMVIYIIYMEDRYIYILIVIYI